MQQTEQATKTFVLQEDGAFPNNPSLPLVIHRSALAVQEGDRAGSIERAFQANGWKGTWRDSIYPYHHYHSTAHEALGVFAGRARVQFGGPHGVEVELEAGDVAVIPAGTAHKRLTASADFGVVGAYPAGTNWDMCRGEPEETEGARQNIARVPLPASDPVYGRQGGVMEIWAERSTPAT